MIGARGRDLIRSFEALRLTAYDDGTGVWTIGWGHTHGVKDGDTATREQAEQMFSEDLAEAEAGIDRLVTRKLGECQRDALASFIFNLGAGKRVAESELIRNVNDGHHFAACRSFLNWSMAGGRPMRGLMKRRLAEASLYAADQWLP